MHPKLQYIENKSDRYMSSFVHMKLKSRTEAVIIAVRVASVSIALVCIWHFVELLKSI